MFQAKMLPIYLGKFSQISAFFVGFVWPLPRLADWLIGFWRSSPKKSGAVKQITVSVGMYWLSDFWLGDKNYKYWMGVSNMTEIFSHFIWMNSMIFQRGRSTTNQYNNYKFWMVVSNIFISHFIYGIYFFWLFFGITTYDNVTTHMIVNLSRRARTRCRTLWRWHKTTVVLIRGGTLETTTSGAGKTRHIHPWQLDV